VDKKVHSWLWSRAPFLHSHWRSSVPTELRLGNCGRTLSEGIFKFGTFLRLFLFQIRSCLDLWVSRTPFSTQILDLQKSWPSFPRPLTALEEEDPWEGASPQHWLPPSRDGAQEFVTKGLKLIWFYLLNFIFCWICCLLWLLEGEPAMLPSPAGTEVAIISLVWQRNCIKGFSYLHARFTCKARLSHWARRSLEEKKKKRMKKPIVTK